MNTNTLSFAGISRVTVVALALLVASCIKSTPTLTYKIGGTVSGLTGTGLVLQNNGGDNLAIAGNGAFTFSRQLKKDTGYSVTVLVQPTGQTCTVTNGSGTVTADVTNVAVNCAGAGFTVGGTASGLSGPGLVLQNNGGNNLSVANGSFTFSTLLSSGTLYGVSVLSQPAGQGCTVANGSGTIAGANVTNVTVTCASAPAAPTLSLVGFGVKELQFSWAAVSGAAFYRLLESPDGVSAYNVAASNIVATSYNHTIPVHRRLGASYKLEACNAGGCSVSLAVNLGANLAQAIGYAKASNTTTGDQFGWSVAVSGDGNTLAVGAPNEDGVAANSGAVYVFTKTAGGWSQPVRLKASNPGVNDTFGFAVALNSDGNTLAVGARGQANTGAVYVFTRSAGTWSQPDFIKDAHLTGFAHFGASVALSGDGNMLAVGADAEQSAATGINGNPVDDCNGPDFLNCAVSGAAYVYTRSSGAWSLQAYVKASNTEEGDSFGSVVALSGDGDTLAVGAPGESSGLIGVTPGSVSETAAPNAAFMSGAAYVYTRSGAVWTQQAYVKASNTGVMDVFGSWVALSSDGTTLAVGAPHEDGGATGVGGASNESAADAGAAYVYSRSGTAWSFQAYVKASNTGSGDQFGTALVLSGDGNTLAVGAPFENSLAKGIGGNQVNDCAAGVPFNCAAASGAAYVYSRSGTTWSHKAYVKASNTENDDRFGWAIGLSGDGNTLAVGARQESGGATGIGPTQDNNDARTSGAAYLY